LNVERAWPLLVEPDALSQASSAPQIRQFPDAHDLLARLVGKDIRTVTGATNRVLAIEDENAIVATERTPTGAPV
jgi:hypothetical protein